MSRIGREFRPLVKQLQKLGYSVVNGKRHAHLVDGAGNFISSVPNGTSCPRAVKNWRAQLRGKGVPLD